MLCLEYKDPLEKHHYIKVLKCLRDGALSLNEEKWGNIYSLKVKCQTFTGGGH
jgi:hypothetical protein